MKRRCGDGALLALGVAYLLVAVYMRVASIVVVFDGSGNHAVGRAVHQFTDPPRPSVVSRRHVPLVGSLEIPAVVPDVAPSLPEQRIPLPPAPGVRTSPQRDSPLVRGPPHSA